MHKHFHLNEGGRDFIVGDIHGCFTRLQAKLAGFNSSRLMAPRPKTICRKAACGALIDAPGYCAKHAQLKVGWTASHEGKTAAQRGLDYAWQQLRKRILSRDGGLCQIKGSGCEYVAREVDHIVGRAKASLLGWTRAQTDAETNLQSACKPCHRAKSEAESASARGRV